jgi:NAD(P)-dependent dehydrogenase (short-subunit alcohol dehydrogenase family)
MDQKNAKVVLITGGSSGIGEATALRLTKAGYIVYAAARRLERMKGLQAQGVHVLKLDVTDDASMVAGVEGILKDQGRIDVLVNNAGYGSFGALEDVPLSEAKAQFEVNLFGLARLIQLVLPAMRRHRFGRIINISSIAGKVHEPMGSWYHATKFALEGLSDCLRIEVRPFGVDVVVIEPGGIRTEWGGIAVDSLLKVSGKTAYQDLARKGAAFITSAQKRASPPDAIARVIEKAVRARKPRTRYAAGYGAGLALLTRRVLSDRAYDKVTLALLRRAKGATRSCEPEVGT